MAGENMSDDDFKELRRLLEQAQEDARVARLHSEKLHRALLEVPIGSPDDERPLIEGLRIMWRSYQRGAWITRATIVIIPLTAAIGTALLTMRGWVSWK